jgi:hypothetical protein
MMVVRDLPMPSTTLKTKKGHRSISVDYSINPRCTIKEKYNISFCITRSHYIATASVSIIVAKNIVSFCEWDKKNDFWCYVFHVIMNKLQQ